MSFYRVVRTLVFLALAGWVGVRIFHDATTPPEGYRPTFPPGSVDALEPILKDPVSTASKPQSAP